MNSPPSSSPPPPPGWSPQGGTIPPVGAGPRPIMHMPVMAGPTPVVVQVKAKSGGLTRAVMFVLGLALFAGAFVVGIIVGVGGMLAGAEYNSMVLQEPYRRGGAQEVAIVPIVGEIDDRQAAFVHAAVEHILDESNFSGVILRVDSPGGAVAPSDQIWHEVERLKNAGLPVIASYGGMAASGGYYVSCGADAIVAEETCITGSIGAIGQVLTFSEAMQKIGVQPVTVVSSGSPEKDVANDPFRPWTEKDKQTVRLMLDAAYSVFFDRVKAGRIQVIKDISSLRSVADGRVFTAKQALENGLIDSIGYLDDAIAQLETRCGIPSGRANVIMLQQPPSLFGDGLLGLSRGGLGSTDTSPLPAAAAALNGESLRKMLNELSSPRVMYLMH
jgi:protease-4